MLPCPTACEAEYGLATLDQYGRLADRTVLRALHWGPGHPLALTLVSGSVLVVARDDATARVGNDGYLRLPVGVRRACRLMPGDRVLLVADPSAGRLLLHPPAALGALLDAHHAAILSGATP
ncbi:AbrB/MazE/SpoVT family DNA-binding domain-containing protein [Pseudonocardia sp.]|uniref:AbrB/MazE/SpoVT family DNA-binding domain-containing protein n=1 Tax=Pseudonocardia sp. TaxID=60912 RepID=UPI00260F9C67|nr:AbrB/MazE/SpoVT family DNA-binding domain-containing protein [Pseudonocardia sp.]